MSDPTPDPDSTVTLIIPQFLQNSLSCFKAKRGEDITHIYKITLKTPEDQTLYVDNEQDLRDTLKQYCLYRQLCEKVDDEMKKLNLEFQLSENSVRLVKSSDAKTNEYDNVRGPRFNFESTNNMGCDPECGRQAKSKVLFPSDPVTPTVSPVPAPGDALPPAGGCDATCAQNAKKGCCTIS